MTESKCEPEQFKGRIIFMSMYNDIDWTKRGNKGICVANALEITEYALFSFRPISYHKSIGGRSSSRWSAGRATSSRRRGAGRSRRVAAASRRSGRNARRAGSGVARFVHVMDLARESRAIMVFAWWNRCIIRPCCAADGGAGGELRGRASLAAVSFSRHIRLASFCAFVQSRRRPEKWTRTWKAGSRGSVTRDFVCVSTFGRRASSPSRSSPTPSSFVKTRLRNTS